MPFQHLDKQPNGMTAYPMHTGEAPAGTYSPHKCLHSSRIEIRADFNYLFNLLFIHSCFHWQVVFQAAAVGCVPVPFTGHAVQPHPGI